MFKRWMFSGTAAVFIVAICVSWMSRDWLRGFWISPVLDAASRAGADVHFLDPSRLVFTHQVLVTTALLLTVPVFAAEAWLFLCQLTRRERAERFTVPFSIASTGAIGLALWLVRQTEISFFVELL